MRFNRFSLILLTLAVPVLLLTGWVSAHIAQAQPYSYPPLTPALLLNKITVIASNTPTQTTVISVTNSFTSAAGVAVTVYKGSEAGNQQA